MSMIIFTPKLIKHSAVMRISFQGFNEVKYFQYSLYCLLVRTFKALAVNIFFVFVLLCVSRSDVMGLEFCFHGRVSKIQHRLPITYCINNNFTAQTWKVSLDSEFSTFSTFSWGGITSG